MLVWMIGMLEVLIDIVEPKHEYHAVFADATDRELFKMLEEEEETSGYGEAIRREIRSRARRNAL